MRLITLVLLLSGCSSYWQTDMPGYRVQRIDVSQPEDWQKRCGRSDALACAVRINSTRTTYIYAKPALTDEEWACILAHEARHAGGQNHDARTVYSLGC